jgi:hypothetical protein
MATMTMWFGAIFCCWVNQTVTSRCSHGYNKEENCTQQLDVTFNYSCTDKDNSNNDISVYRYRDYRYYRYMATLNR